MFRGNEGHRQTAFFSTVQHMPVGVKKMLEGSWAPAFRGLIFEKIDERRYFELYSPIGSRPNFPVNIWVGLEIIKGLFDYTDQELLEQFHFNLLTSYALGQENLGEVTLCERTLYYNRERLLEYEQRTGRNLLEEEFKAITEEALDRLPIDPRTQRMDSSFLGSFIKQMSRLELIVKVLKNLYHDLPPDEQTRWASRLAEYIDEEARHISYRLKRAEVEKHLRQLGTLLFELHQSYAIDEAISGLVSYEHVARVLLEQFSISEEAGQTTIALKPSKEISTTSLQNPADDEATFRRKNGESHKGYLLNVTETCSPENPVQLLTDICVRQNIVSDDAILSERLPEIKERTGVKEMIVDANFTSETSEAVCDEQGVNIVPTEVKGRHLSKETLSLTDFCFEGYRIISCPAGHSPLEQIDKAEKAHHIVRFLKEQCSSCPQVKGCPVRCRKHFYSLSFDDRQLLLARRRQQLTKEDYQRKCRLRPAIEGTISQFKQRTHNSKLRVRGLGKVRNSVILMAIAINFGRIWAYSLENTLDPTWFLILGVLLLLFLAESWVKRSNRVALGV